jgi:tetratricopeptide (TPR) repeat protein
MLSVPTFAFASPLDDLNFSFESGIEFNSRGQYADASDEFDQVIRLKPQWSEAWVGKGIALRGGADYGGAIDCFKKAIELDPKCETASIEFKKLEKYEEARRIIKLIPEYAESWCHMGNVILDIGKRTDDHYPASEFAYNKARKYFEQAINMSPQYAEAWLGLSIAIYSMGGDYYELPSREYDALEAINTALEINPQYAEARHFKGVILSEEGINYHCLKTGGTCLVRFDPQSGEIIDQERHERETI